MTSTTWRVVLILLASLGGAVEGLVPSLVARRLKQKFKLPVPKENQIGWEY